MCDEWHDGRCARLLVVLRRDEQNIQQESTITAGTAVRLPLAPPRLPSSTTAPSPSRRIAPPRRQSVWTMPCAPRWIVGLEAAVGSNHSHSWPATCGRGRSVKPRTPVPLATSHSPCRHNHGWRVDGSAAFKPNDGAACDPCNGACGACVESCPRRAASPSAWRTTSAASACWVPWLQTLGCRARKIR